MTQRLTPDTVLRGRRDLVWQAQAGGWLVFDPLVRSGYRCGEAERWLFEQFDGQRRLSDIHHAAAVRPGTYIISVDELITLAETLLRRSLVRDATSTKSVEQRVTPQRTWLQWFSQSVSWRLRGIDPQPLLQRLNVHSGLFFATSAVRVWCCVIAVVSLFVLADFSRLLDQARLWDWLIQPTSGSTLFAIFLVTRGVHELGHALVLTRFGGRCPDIGLIFMLGAPCVYCDVTESWRLPSARQRAAVAAGGMYAESIVAALAGVLWLSTTDGAINTLALQTMIVCSISTWLVNANPLMRFDGYYILSDWLDEPNLRARADECLMHKVKQWVLGEHEQRKQSSGRWRSTGLALFSLCGIGYRLTLSWMMASVIAAMYAAWHFAWLGRIIAALLLVCWWGIPLMKFCSQLLRAAQSSRSRTRLALLVGCLVCVVWAIPIPYRESAIGWVQPEQMQGLYAPQSARLRDITRRSGARVKAGDVVFKLDDAQSQIDKIDRQRTAAKVAVQLASLERERISRDKQVRDSLALESRIETANGQVGHSEETIKRLSVQADFAGTLISLPAPQLLDIDGHPVTSAPTMWLEESQCGRMVSQGTMLGAVCSAQQLAVVPLKDYQLRDIAGGCPVRLFIPAMGDQVLSCQVKSVVQLEELDSIARFLAAASHPSAPGVAPPPSQTTGQQKQSGYAAIISIPASATYVNSEVRAVFTVPARTLASRASDWAHQNLRWLME